MEKNTYNDNANYYVKKHNVLFYNIPKVASTSLWSISAQLEKGYTPTKREDVRKFKLPNLKSSALSKFSKVKKIAFVRNPFDRLVSAYSNKIERNDIKFIKRNRLHKDMIFSEFVEHVCSLKDYESDKHFRSQYTFLFNDQGQLILDYLGRFETFENDIKMVFDQFDLPKVEVPHWNKSNQTSYIDYYTEELVQKVAQRYALDLQLFGYQYDSNIIDKDRWKKITPEQQIEILQYKSQKLLRIVKIKEKYDDLPKGFRGLLIRKYKEYFTEYFNEDLTP